MSTHVRMTFLFWNTAIEPDVEFISSTSVHFVCSFVLLDVLVGCLVGSNRAFLGGIYQGGDLSEGDLSGGDLS